MCKSLIMKAIRVNSYGDSSVLRYEDHELPSLLPGQSLVEIYAAGVTLTDIWIRQGLFDGVWGLSVPYTPGWDYAGVVRIAGSDAPDLSIGQLVFGMLPGQGTYAEFAAVASESVAAVPREFDFESAAAFPLAATTAYKALVEVGQVVEGEKVLILVAAGGVGSFAVQLSKSLRAIVVGAAAVAKHSYVRGLGADWLLDSASSISAWREVGADLILDTVGPAADGILATALKPGGRVVRIAGPPASVAALNARGIQATFSGTEPNSERLRLVAAMAGAHNWSIPVSRRFPLSHAALAHQALEQRTVEGKIVLQVRDHTL